MLKVIVCIFEDPPWFVRLGRPSMSLLSSYAITFMLVVTNECAKLDVM